VRIVIDTERCSGQGRCYVLAPSLFVDDDRGYGVVRGDGTVAPEHEADAGRAVVACPEQAISLEPRTEA
jgi:ferredoxin